MDAESGAAATRGWVARRSAISGQHGEGREADMHCCRSGRAGGDMGELARTLRSHSATSVQARSTSKTRLSIIAASTVPIRRPRSLAALLPLLPCRPPSPLLAPPLLHAQPRSPRDPLSGCPTPTPTPTTAHAARARQSRERDMRCGWRAYG
jgi:hypothetical protein